MVFSELGLKNRFPKYVVTEIFSVIGNIFLIIDYSMVQFRVVRYTQVVYY